MNRILILCCIYITLSSFTTSSSIFCSTNPNQTGKDSTRIKQLDLYWKDLTTSVQKGDIENYLSAYHPDAVVIFGDKISLPINEAMDMWRQGFLNTKAGIANSDVQFRFSKRIGNETTAFEKGMFLFTMSDVDGNIQKSYAHFEALLVKKGNNWQCIMENQKSTGTEHEWVNLN